MISNDEAVVSGALSSADDFAISASSTSVARKPSWYGKSWGRRPDIMTNTNTCSDIFMSNNGETIAVAIRDSSEGATRSILYSNNFGTSFASSATTKNWLSICGTTTGDAIWAIQGAIQFPSTPFPREIWRSNDRGATWTQQASPPDFTNADPRRMRVSGDGKFQLMSDRRLNSLGKIYKSSDYGGSWVSQNLTVARSTAFAVAVSASGRVQYVELSGTSEGLHADNGNGGLYRSLDYGATWFRVNTDNQIGYLSCDATGRVVALTNGFEVITSRNYGATWTASSNIGAVAVHVSPNGNLIWVGCVNQTTTTQLYYSDDYGQSFTVANTEPAGNYVYTDYTQIATNNDGTIVFGGAVANLNSCRQAPCEVATISAGSGMSVSISNEGFATISSLITDDFKLWSSGNMYVLSSAYLIFPWSTQPKIDLSLYNIKYEMDIHWDHSTTSVPYAFIELAINETNPASSFLPQGTINPAVTNWTNNANNGTGGIDEYNQSYTNRFYSGFSGTQALNGAGYRYKTIISGEISLARRLTAQAGTPTTDTITNSRIITNRFECDNFTEQNTGSGTWGINQPGFNETNQQHCRIHGTSIWDTSFGGAWDSNSGLGTSINQGVYQLYLRLHEGANFLTLRTRGAQVIYRIYRIKK
jgi:hypothetical protein